MAINLQFFLHLQYLSWVLLKQLGTKYLKRFHSKLMLRNTNEISAYVYVEKMKQIMVMSGCYIKSIE